MASSVGVAPVAGEFRAEFALIAFDGRIITPYGLGHSVEMSPDGSKIAVITSEKLVEEDIYGATDLYIYNRLDGTVELISKPVNEFIITPGYITLNPHFSPDGTRLAFISTSADYVAGDNNNVADVYVKDFVTGEITLESKSPSGVLGNGESDEAIFLDNENLLIRTMARNLDDKIHNSGRQYYVKNLVSQSVKLLTFNDRDGTIPTRPLVGSSTAWNVAPAAKKFIFSSDYSDLVSGDTNDSYDVFILDIDSGDLIRVSTDESGNQLAEVDLFDSDGSFDPAISPDGTKIAFRSSSPDLVENDNNGVLDLFVKDLLTGEVKRINLRTDGSEIPVGAQSLSPIFSPDGTKVAFLHYGLLPGYHLSTEIPQGAYYVLYFYDLVTDKVDIVSRDINGQVFGFRALNSLDWIWTEFGILTNFGILFVQY